MTLSFGLVAQEATAQATHPATVVHNGETVVYC